MRRLAIARLLLTVVAPTAALVLVAWPAAAQTPDFSTVPDILQGRRRLLPEDDLVATLQINSNTGEGPLSNATLLTTNAVIASQQNSVVMQSPGSNVHATAIGRMFNLPYDIIMTATYDATQTPTFSLTDPVLQQTSSFFFPAAFVGPTCGFTCRALVLADFNRDGYADVLMANSPFIATGFGGFAVGTAVDTAKPSAGLNWGPLTAPLNPLAFAVGDFNGDGQPDIAVTTATGQAVLLQIYQVDPTTLAITLAGSTSISSPFPIPSGVLGVLKVVAGQFDSNTADDELLVLWGQSQGQAMFASVNVSAALQPTVGQTLETANINLQNLMAVSGRLQWFGQTDQVVFAFNSFNNNFSVWVLTFSGDGNLAVASQTVVGNQCNADFPTLQDLALGNFDQAVGNTLPPNLQIALLQAFPGCSDGVFAQILSVNPANDFALTSLQSWTVFQQPVPANPFFLLSLASGDLQGRSLVLGGPPSKITVVQHSQPEIILGAPPMHADWAIPVGGTTATDFNVSVVPDGFFSQYQTVITNTNQSSRTSTTSYSFSTTESAQETVSFGIPDVASVSATLQQWAQQTYSNVVATTFNTYASQAFDASTQTGFGDQVWFTQKRFNVYTYPVIGYAACPSGQANCGDAQKLPLNVQFSGPDQITEISINASTVEWYQPFHEPGNALSYPWNFNRLQQQNQNLVPLTGTSPTAWFTDSSTETEMASWSAGQGNNVSVGSTRTFSFGGSVSVSASVNFVADAFSGGGGASASFSFNQSESVSTLNSTTETVGASTGIGVNKPGTFPNPGIYQYPVLPFVFGEQNPPGTVQQITLPTDITSTGTLQTAFAADPTNPLAGGWWSQTYALPDVALNHPVRWSVDTLPTTTPNCIRVSPSSSALNCVTFNSPILNDLWLSEFHWMRGLLVTPATPSGSGGGPQALQVTAGESLLLQATVYNYSLVDMAATTTVHVRFYAQPWDTTGNTPIGPSVLVAEDLLGPIPGFNSVSNDGELPNWAMASATFPTTSGDAGTYFVFWVVVWMQDANGLVAEIPDHGLTALPGPLSSIADVPIEGHSNNVGFLKAAILIAAASSGSVPPRNGQLTVKDVAARPDPLLRHERGEVRAQLVTGAAPVDGVLVTFYLGDPRANGKAFDVELVSHIRPHATYQVRVPFRARSCGPQEIFVVASTGATAPVTGMTRLTVACEPSAVSNLSGRATGIASRRDNGSGQLAAQFAFAGALDLGAATLTIDSMLSEGGIDLLKGPRGEALFPLTLMPARGGKPTNALFHAASRVPGVRADVKARKGNLEAIVQITRGLIPQAPRFCSTASPTTELKTRMILDDRIHAPVVLAVTARWECVINPDGSVRELRLRAASATPR